MGKTRDTSKIFTTTSSANYLTQSSASVTYATKAEVAIIDVDNIPDTFLAMG